MTHLTPAEFVDAAEGSLDVSRLKHVDICHRCRSELDALIEMIREAPVEPVAEPSPLFWEHFSARVRDAVVAEQRDPRPAVWWGTRRWSGIVPLGAFAALILAVVASLPPRTEPPVVETRLEGPTLEAADGVATDQASADAEWWALAELLESLDWDNASDAGLVIGPGTADAAIDDLTVDERRELTRLVSNEMGRPRS